MLRCWTPPVSPGFQWMRSSAVRIGERQRGLAHTLARIYAEASKRWRWYHEDEAFDEEFVQLFRGRDQQVARL